MKIRILALLLLCTIGAKTNAEIIAHEPQGEYAKINKNNKASLELYDILIGKTKGDKAEAALQAEKSLGSQTPFTILELGSFYLSQGNFAKATLYHRFAMFRAAIDVHASKDDSLGDVIPILYSWVQEATSKLNERDQKTYIDNLKTATKKVIALDKDTPRNYDIRWASLHSVKAFTNGPLNYPDEEGLKKIIEKEREAYIAAAKKDGIW